METEINGYGENRENAGSAGCGVMIQRDAVKHYGRNGCYKHTCGRTQVTAPPSSKRTFYHSASLFLNCSQTIDSPSQNKTALFHQAVSRGSAK